MTAGRTWPAADRSRPDPASPQRDRWAAGSRWRWRRRRWSRQCAGTLRARAPRRSPPGTRGKALRPAPCSRVSNTRLCPFRPNTGGSDSHRAARIDQGPMAMTTASPSMVCAVDLDTSDARPAAVAHDARHLTLAQLGSLRLGRAHHGGGELARVHLGGCLRRSQATVDCHAVRHPVDSRGDATTVPAVPCAGEAAIGGEAAIAPIAADLFRQARVQGKAAPRQRLERAAVAPVERQEAARLAGRRARDAPSVR